MFTFNRPFDPEQLRLLIFDLEGTLVDSRLDLIYSVNAMRRHLDLSDLSGEMIASYVGDGAAMLVRRALSDAGNGAGDEKFLRQATDYFLDYYGVHKLDHTRVYGGVIEMLAAARTSRQGSSRQLAVLSNKPVIASRGVVDGLGIAHFFVAVCGGNSFATQKPDPLGAQQIMEETGTEPDQTLIVGDSANDVLTGRNAGAWTCGVTYGFAPQTLSAVAPDVVVDTADELRRLLAESVHEI